MFWFISNPNCVPNMCRLNSNWNLKVSLCLIYIKYWEQKSKNNFPHFPKKATFGWHISSTDVAKTVSLIQFNNLSVFLSMEIHLFELINDGSLICVVINIKILYILHENWLFKRMYFKNWLTAYLFPWQWWMVIGTMILHRSYRQPILSKTR